MDYRISDISGEIIAKEFLLEDARVLVGKVIFHTTAEEQIEIVKFIKKLQEERLPDSVTIPEFEPFGDAAKELEQYEAYLKRVAEQKASEEAEEE